MFPFQCAILLDRLEESQDEQEELKKCKTVE